MNIYRYMNQKAQQERITILGRIASLEAEGQTGEMRRIGRALDAALDGAGIEDIGYIKGLIRTFAMVHKLASDGDSI
jgi:hypothetical protein